MILSWFSIRMIALSYGEISYSCMLKHSLSCQKTANKNANILEHVSIFQLVAVLRTLRNRYEVHYTVGFCKWQVFFVCRASDIVPVSELKERPRHGESRVANSDRQIFKQSKHDASFRVEGKGHSAGYFVASNKKYPNREVTPERVHREGKLEADLKPGFHHQGRK